MQPNAECILTLLQRRTHRFKPRLSWSSVA